MERELGIEACAETSHKVQKRVFMPSAKSKQAHACAYRPEAESISGGLAQ